MRYGNVIGSRGSVIPYFKKAAKTGKLPVTDPRMTRFWIRLEEGAVFVARCIGMMQGGEIFVPKIRSMRVSDLAKAVCADCEHEIIGIRPGEKLHEILIARDDARYTSEFSDFYIIQPAIRLWDTSVDTIYEGEEGKPVRADFEYASDSNESWLDVSQLLNCLHD